VHVVVGGQKLVGMRRNPDSGALTRVFGARGSHADTRTVPDLLLPLPALALRSCARAWRQAHATLPRLGFFADGRAPQAAIPADWADVLGLVAPRPALVVQPDDDRTCNASAGRITPPTAGIDRPRPRTAVNAS
jgi:hypothetical protein